ncbi:unnamed protein product [Linum tenue]|uniref:Uncharacterized protein n=1 Tax=Linum tenue TaxID=586396 RepID=A0AAV0PTN9_9ROSI|nr:unnamed protein product [Linum tenue]
MQRNPNYARDRDDTDGGDTNTSGDSRTVENFIPLSHVKSITSTSNPFVRHCVKLCRSSPYWHSHGSALVIGTTLIREISKFEESLQDKTTQMDYLFFLDNVNVPAALETRKFFPSSYSASELVCHEKAFTSATHEIH